MPRPSWRCALCHAAPPDVVRSKKKRALCDLCYDGLAPRGLAWCTRGRHRVAIAAMTKRGKDCRACDAASQRTYYHAHSERERALQRAYYHADPAAERKRNAAYRARNRQQINARRRAQRAQNPELYRQRARAYHRAHPERARARSRLWRKTHPDAMRVWRLRAKLRILQQWRRAA